MKCECEFENEREDNFCGGCGKKIEMDLLDAAKEFRKVIWNGNMTDPLKDFCDANEKMFVS